MKTREFKQLRLTPTQGYKAASDGSSFEGYAAVWGNIDRQGDIIAPKALEWAAGRYLKNGPILLWQHNDDWPVGRIDEASEDRFGLKIKARIIDTNLGMETRKLVKEGVVTAMSIGYECRKSRDLNSREGINNYLKSIGRPADPNAPSYGVRIIEELEIFEVSLVSVPANPEARVTGVKSYTTADLEECLKRLKAFLRQAKAGRTVSAANHARLSELRGAIEGALADLASFLDEHGFEDMTAEDAKAESGSDGPPAQGGQGQKPPPASSDGEDEPNDDETEDEDPQDKRKRLRVAALKARQFQMSQLVGREHN